MTRLESKLDRRSRRRMVHFWRGLFIAVALLVTSVRFCGAQDRPLTLDDLLDRAQQWAEDNLDTNVLNSLSQLNQQALQAMGNGSNQPVEDEWVVNFTPLKIATQGLLTVLGSNEDIHPYTAWLSGQLEDIDTSDDIHISILNPDAETNAVTSVSPATPLSPAPGGTGPDSRRWPVGAKIYVPALKAIFATQKAPPELVWIAEVESAFDRHAVSPAGAAGLFQLMPDTAKRFGLSLWPTDERYKAERSAKASARYLKVLHDQFQDWRLSLAAYNAGEGTVQKLLDRYKAHTFEEIAPYLPVETQSYVPRVEAIILDREGAKLPELGIPK